MVIGPIRVFGNLTRNPSIREWLIRSGGQFLLGLDSSHLEQCLKTDAIDVTSGGVKAMSEDEKGGDESVKIIRKEEAQSHPTAAEDDDPACWRERSRDGLELHRRASDGITCDWRKGAAKHVAGIEATCSPRSSQPSLVFLACMLDQLDSPRPDLIYCTLGVLINMMSDPSSRPLLTQLNGMPR
ncbi:unnamed protein product [Protopolystoma xenopodis]|uniref:Uncharacterized protein n=1 Tax=Protopolystoma xenopodis TaxID=117903 RepID=A0A448XLX2_9PLAT|nr:unnamed protein product [Protopolystoma xenopodis]